MVGSHKSSWAITKHSGFARKGSEPPPPFCQNPWLKKKLKFNNFCIKFGSKVVLGKPAKPVTAKIPLTGGVAFCFIRFLATTHRKITSPQKRYTCFKPMGDAAKRGDTSRGAIRVTGYRGINTKIAHRRTAPPRNGPRPQKLLQRLRSNYHHAKITHPQKLADHSKISHPEN